METTYNFPEGRVDSLMSHLLRQCSNTNGVERVFVSRAIHHQNPTPRIPRGTKSNSPGQNRASEQIDPQSELPPPVSYQQQQSALDTLAEVSRHHLDISHQERHGLQASVKQKKSFPGRQHAEEQFYAQLRDAVKAAPDASHVENSPQTAEPCEAIPARPPLAETASAANERLEESESKSRQQNLDPALERQEEPVQAISYVPDVPADGQPNARKATEGPSEVQPSEAPIDDYHHSMQWVPNGPVEAHPSSYNLASIMATSKRPVSFLSEIVPAHASNHNHADVIAASKQPVAGFGPLRNSAKARSKFSDNRRKQVQEIRKRGACIRCRMLKKPCSEGTPCNACKVLGSARLWKGSCLRTRLADEFTLWSVGRFNSEAKTAVASAFQGLEAPPTKASIEVRLLSNSGMHMTLAANRYSQNGLARQRAALNAYSGTDPELVLRAQFDAHMTSLPVYLLEEEAEVLSRLEEYFSQNIDAYIEAERSAFFKSHPPPCSKFARRRGR